MDFVIGLLFIALLCLFCVGDDNFKLKIAFGGIASCHGVMSWRNQDEYKMCIQDDELAYIVIKRVKIALY